MQSTRPGERMTFTELRENVFGGSISSARLTDGVQLLAGLGHATLEKPGGTGGRSPLVFQRTTPSADAGASEKQEKQEKPRNGGGDEDFSGFSGFSEAGA